MRRSALLVALLLAFCVGIQAKAVRGYTKKDGTYVQPHQKTAPNKTKNDNYSSKGNTNPYTGKKGTKPRDGEASQAKP